MQSGIRLGPYEILTALGAGGMGEIYKARDERLGRDVAIKVLSAHAIDSPQARERFQREARAVAALQHPNICTVHDIGETADGHAFIVMELLHGETLQERLRRGPLEVTQATDVAIALSDALHTAHAAGIVHRDIKPANIFLTDRGPKILDFGLAKTDPHAAGEHSEVETRALLTEAGGTVGTVAYMSPEQLRGEAVDARTDLFSFGLVLYEMATGRHAFTEPTSAAIGAAILHQEPFGLRSANPELPAALEHLVLKALEKDRGLRYQHASDMRADLQRLKRGSGSTPTTVSTGAVARHSERRATIAASVVAGVILLGLGAAGYYFYSSKRAAPKLTDLDTIVLGDFANSTGDPVFDDTLRQGLTVQLQQSPILRLLSTQKIGATLRLMGQPPDTRLTPAVARQICERTASAAVLDGSIATLGTQYVLGLRATDCRSGNLIDQQQSQAARKEDVLGVLSQIATTFRIRIGESLSSAERNDKPLAEATTVSLDALKAFTASLKAAQGGNESGIPFLKRAVEIDPTFATAHALLGLHYSGTGERQLAIDSIRKAYELRDRASDPEKFFIQFVYNRDVTGNLEETYQTLRLWVQTYPRDSLGQGLLAGYGTNGTGRYEEAIEAATRAIALDPDSMFPYASLAWGHLRLDRAENAREALRQAEGRADSPDLTILRLYLAFLRNDTAEIERAFAGGKGKAQEDWVVHSRALLYAYQGQLGRARSLTHTATDIALRAGRTESAAAYTSGVAVWEAFYGDDQLAIRSATAALAQSNSRDVEYGAGFALALAGDLSRVDALAADLERRFPDDTNAKFTYVPTLRALVALRRRDFPRALEWLRMNEPYELAIAALPYNNYYGALYPVYVRGEVYRAQARTDEALAEFAKIQQHRGLVLADPVAVMVKIQRGRAYAAAGDTAKARSAYDEFFTLWKDANADVPLLVQAKAEYAKLR